jgi:succinyl-CoA synthetase alpha subunit
MSVFVDKGTRVVVQGITGRDGSFHAAQMLEYGTQVVAGVTPGKGGQHFEGRIPIFDTVESAVGETDGNTSIIYVPAPYAADAVCEAAAAGIRFIVCVTEGIPVKDVARALPFVEAHGSRLLGPNCPGLVAAHERVKVGILPASIFLPGPVGVVSRSGTLTYEVVFQLTRAGIGQSTCVGIGGDPLIGTHFVDVLEAFQKDDRTEAIVLIGEIGGTDEQEAAAYVAKHVTKPVVAFVAGRTAPEGKRMGHAGAIVSGASGTASGKMQAFEDAGIRVASIPSEIPRALNELRGARRK